MKRFLTSIVISITLITIGFTTLFFEIPTFEIVDVKKEDNVISKSYQIDDLIKNDEIDIEIDGSFMHVTIKEDLNNDDEILIEYSQQITLEQKRSKLLFEGYSRHSFSSFKEMAVKFVDGLKDKKIYVNYGYTDNEIIIHCSAKNRKYLNIDYN